MTSAPLTIALVAGETSGDNLGAPLIRAIKREYPDARFVGIGGSAMIAAGMESWHDIERLSVNGFVDPIKRLPDLIRILFDIRDRVVAADVDCFVGVDFNFFNLLLERMLKNRGVRTAHYVSPTVWAWRKWRINSIGKSVDLMLALYPFETEIYEQNNIDVAFVGHPRADDIDPANRPEAKQGARRTLGLGADGKLIAVLPGSRGSEVKYTGPDFLAAAALIGKRHPGVRFVIPAANDRRKAQLEALLLDFDADLPVTLVDGQSTLVMQASDVVLVNSGTATLEAMLLKRPMVMSYRLGAMTYAIVSRMVTTKWFALPNILAGRPLVPEFIQGAATPQALADAVCSYLENPDQAELLQAFDDIHATLRCDAGVQSANAVIELCQRAGE